MSGLDELFGDDTSGQADDNRPDRHPARTAAVWTLKAALGAAGLAGALVLVLRLLGYELWYPLAAAGFFALLVLHRTVRALGVAPPPRAGAAGVHAAAPATAPAAAAEPDGLALAAGRWQTRLSRGRAGAGRSARTIHPSLAELVDERMRQRRGFTRASDPARARQLLGEALWSYLADPSARTPSSRELAALLTTVEKLSTTPPEGGGLWGDPQVRG